MKNGPALAPVAALVGDPARANMLDALVDGLALTASELAAAAGITAQTASSHLAKLEHGGLITGVKQGRHRYFRLANADVAGMLESIHSVAARTGARTRPGPKDPAMRRARVCYDHLAGEMGVQLYDSLMAKGVLGGSDSIALTPRGETWFAEFGVELGSASRRPVCRACLDWSERRSHLAGLAGAGLLTQITARGWARRDRSSRAMLFTPEGARQFAKTFPL